MAEMRNVRKWVVYVGFRKGQANQSHGMRKGDGAVFGSIEESPFQRTREEGWVKREEKKCVLLVIYVTGNTLNPSKQVCPR
jgi:hypothetical protein